MVQPTATSAWPISTAAALSRSLSETNTRPCMGNSVPAADCALMKARPNVASIPITSPVERISGPNVVSTSGNRLNGNTASFTLTCPVAGGRTRPSSRNCAKVAPSITRLATIAKGTPVALATNGTVRLARGFASMTYTLLSATANCTLMSPRTSSAAAILCTYSLMVDKACVDSVWAGSAHAESPEWMPASSTCSITPPMSTSPVWSRMASTSTSVAPCKKRSMSTGRDDDKPPSRPSEPNSSISAIASAS